MKVQKVEIKNFKGIAKNETQLNGANVFLVAPNGKGKTTFIDACFGQMPGQPLKEGEKNGAVSVDLGDYVVDFKFSSKTQKPKMNIYDKSGRLQKTPAKLFKDLFGVRDFEIDKFLSLTSKKQIETIKEIIGIDWSDVDARYKELYEERKFQTRQAKEIDGEVADRPYNMNMASTSVEALQAELSAINKNNNRVQQVRSGLDDRAERLEKVKEEQKKIEAEALKIAKEISDGREWLSKNQEKESSEIENQISEASKHNAAVIENERIGKLREKAGLIWDEIELTQKEMSEIEETKRRELENTPMPVKGLEFDDEQLYLDGLPFNSNQINTARRIIAGLELQFHMMKEVKIARLDGSLLDKNSMSAVEKWANERGIQLFVELVDRDGSELKIEVSEEEEKPKPKPKAKPTPKAKKPEPGTVGATFTHETQGLTVSGRGTVRKTYKIKVIYPALKSAECQILSDDSVMELSPDAKTVLHLDLCKDMF